MKKIDTILQDVDGLLANFHESAIRAHLHKGPLKLSHGTYRDPNDSFLIASNQYWPRGKSLMKYLGITNLDDFWQPIDRDPLFWRGISPYPWYKQLTDKLQNYCHTLMLCTSPSNHHHSWGGKALWLKLHNLDHLPCIMMNGASNGTSSGTPIGKWMLAAPGRLLIDDFEKQTDPFINAGGQAILFPQPWNRAHQFCNDPVNYTISQLERICEES